MRTRTVADVDEQLARSSRRCQGYTAAGDAPSAAVERHVQNRLLDERLTMTQAKP